MNIRFHHWMIFNRCAAIVAALAVLVLIFRPIPALEAPAYALIFGLGVTGAITAVLLRFRLLKFTCTDAEKQTNIYRMLKEAFNLD